MTLTEYSLRPPNHQFRSEIQHFSGEDTDKNTAKMHQNTPFDVKNSFFSGNISLDSSQTPSPRPILPHTMPSGSAPASAKNSSQIYATVQNVFMSYSQSSNWLVPVVTILCARHFFLLHLQHLTLRSLYIQTEMELTEKCRRTWWSAAARWLNGLMSLTSVPYVCRSRSAGSVDENEKWGRFQ